MSVLELKQEFERTNNVVDITEAIKMLRIFKDGAFDAQPVAAQAEILRCCIRRIVALGNGNYRVEMFGHTSEVILGRIGENSEKEDQKGPRSTLSGVRTVSKLVQVTYK